MSSSTWAKGLSCYYGNSRIIPQALSSTHEGEHIIATIRQRVMTSTSADDYDVDKERLKESDVLILQLLLDSCDYKPNMSLDEAVEVTTNRVLSSFSWRNKLGINSLGTPLEIRRALQDLPYIGSDGRIYAVLPIRFTYRNSTAKMKQVILGLVLKCVEDDVNRLRSVAGEEYAFAPVVYIVDNGGVELRNMDPLFIFTTRHVLDSFPCRELILVRLSYFLTKTAQLILKVSPSDVVRKMRIMSMDEFKREIGVENVPRHLGGQRDMERNKSSAQGAVGIRDILERSGFSTDEIDMFCQHYEKVIAWEENNNSA